jgi:hypothetical protein
MHFAKHPDLRPVQITPPSIHEPPRLIERLKHNWLFTAGVGTLALIVLSGLWYG